MPSASLISSLEHLGAPRAHLVDLNQGSARTSPYLDLVRAVPTGGPPVVLEADRRPTAYIFDGRCGSDEPRIKQWIRRIAFRGDADWVGVFRPGALDVYPAALGDTGMPAPLASTAVGPFRFLELAHRTPDHKRQDGVRNALLNLIRCSIQTAVDQDVLALDALSLVGRAVFWHFLMDRGLLEADESG